MSASKNKKRVFNNNGGTNKSLSTPGRSLDLSLTPTSSKKPNELDESPSYSPLEIRTSDRSTPSANAALAQKYLTPGRQMGLSRKWSSCKKDGTSVKEGSSSMTQNLWTPGFRMGLSRKSNSAKKDLTSVSKLDSEKDAALQQCSFETKSVASPAKTANVELLSENIENSNNIPEVAPENTVSHDKDDIVSGKRKRTSVKIIDSDESQNSSNSMEIACKNVIPQDSDSPRCNIVGGKRKKTSIKVIDSDESDTEEYCPKNSTSKHYKSKPKKATNNKKTKQKLKSDTSDNENEKPELATNDAKEVECDQKEEKPLSEAGNDSDYDFNSCYSLKTKKSQTHTNQKDKSMKKSPRVTKKDSEKVVPKITIKINRRYFDEIKVHNQIPPEDKEIHRQDSLDHNKIEDNLGDGEKIKTKQKLVGKSKPFKKSLSLKKSTNSACVESPEKLFGSIKSSQESQCYIEELEEECDTVSKDYEMNDLLTIIGVSQESRPVNEKLPVVNCVANDDDDFQDNCVPSKVTELEVLVKEKRKELDQLKRAELFHQKHDVKELKELTDVWKKGGQEALYDLLAKIRENEAMDMPTLLKKLNIPPETIGYSIENEDFNVIL